MANGNDEPTDAPELHDLVKRAQELLNIAPDGFPASWQVTLKKIASGRFRPEESKILRGIDKFLSEAEATIANRVPRQIDDRVAFAPIPFRRRLWNIGKDAIAEAANTVFFILVLAATRWIVLHVFGDSQLFDRFPLRYLFDAGDVAVIARFIWNTMRKEE